jgi:hypothetical protein
MVAWWSRHQLDPLTVAVSLLPTLAMGNLVVFLVVRASAWLVSERRELGQDGS